MVINCKSQVSPYCQRVGSVAQYFNDIRKYPILNKNEEKELLIQAQGNNKKLQKEAIEILVNCNQRFVASAAMKYANGDDLLDIINEGNIGLIRAAHKFDPSKGVKFISYAVWWIKNSINECIEKYNRDNETLSYEDYTLNKCTDLDNKFEQINEDFEEKINNIQSRKDAIESLMKCLHEREIKILTLFFGLNGGKEMTLDEVGKEMCLTNERVRQIKDSALSKLKCEVLTYSDDEIDTFKLLR